MFLAAARAVPTCGSSSRRWSAARSRPARANAFNCYLDRDIDEVMHRTEQPPAGRPGRSRRATALRLRRRARRRSRSLWLGLLVNWLSAALVAGRDPLLRRRLHDDAQAAHLAEHRLGRRRRLHAGAHRLVRGDRTRWPGRRSCSSCVIFFWTPPHYWPLSMRFQDDYAAAGVPMLPVVAKDVAVARQIVALHAGRWSPARCCWCRSPTWAGSTRSSRSSPAPCSCCEAHRLLARAKAPETRHGVAQADAAVPLLDHAT